MQMPLSNAVMEIILLSGRIGNYFPYLALFEANGELIRDMRFPGGAQSYAEGNTLWTKNYWIGIPVYIKECRLLSGSMCDGCFAH